MAELKLRRSDKLLFVALGLGAAAWAGVKYYLAIGGWVPLFIGVVVAAFGYSGLIQGAAHERIINDDEDKPRPR